ncbi:hypothetical protein JZ751_011659 [Albula glossodonta]|uniref:Uncharacterized protein n=1 Tax=Albula glossodonta TaxID=121402 RepID=A0A8T2PQB8_9TELE|nr:hypothetical protein JZ751_011659 [Albula glossodonta]
MGWRRERPFPRHEGSSAQRCALCAELDRTGPDPGLHWVNGEAVDSYGPTPSPRSLSIGHWLAGLTPGQITGVHHSTTLLDWNMTLLPPSPCLQSFHHPAGLEHDSPASFPLSAVIPSPCWTGT